MNVDEAKVILGDAAHEDGLGPSYGHYMFWRPDRPERIVLDSEFTPLEIEAVLTFIRGFK